ncbi:galectin-8 [Nelusetta ayraudi]|uniref:galectin-8 n=1 Tax=Nelusetta ayraudi TaxID=303726 RepID=UPI003F72A148
MSVMNPRQTFLNLSLPFSGTILGGLAPGEMVLIQGSVPADADRFQVDLCCGSSVQPRADVAFHFNPRFCRSPCIVCNTLLGGRWGREEILPHPPFRAGATFELIILVLEDHFKVAVDGSHVLKYDHRVALQRVDTLSISGRVTVTVVGILPSLNSAEASPTNQQPHMKQPMRSRPCDLRVPFRRELLGGLSPGRSITVQGETNHNPDSFSINLRVSGSSDIALHLNPRLKKGVFVRNSFLRGHWGPEETSGGPAPFAAARYFEVIVLCDPQQFKVAVDGRHLLDYKHRVKELRSITQLEVEGDVTLHDVQIV